MVNKEQSLFPGRISCMTEGTAACPPDHLKSVRDTRVTWSWSSEFYSWCHHTCYRSVSRHVDGSPCQSEMQSWFLPFFFWETLLKAVGDYARARILRITHLLLFYFASSKHRVVEGNGVLLLPLWLEWIVWGLWMLSASLGRERERGRERVMGRATWPFCWSCDIWFEKLRLASHQLLCKRQSWCSSWPSAKGGNPRIHVRLDCLSSFKYPQAVRRWRRMTFVKVNIAISTVALGGGESGTAAKVRLGQRDSKEVR